MSRKQSDRCVFCNWTRRSSCPTIRFFNIPKEPGLKKVRWLQAFGDRKISHRDRVCSIHFRSGRPTNDPSHEDFAPHMYLNDEPPPELMKYLEQSLDKDSDNAKILAAAVSVDDGEIHVKVCKDPKSGSDKLLPLLPKKGTSIRPAILQRKRKALATIKDEPCLNDDHRSSASPASGTQTPDAKIEPTDAIEELIANYPGTSKIRQTYGKNVKVVPINKCLIDVAGIRVGSHFVIKRKVKQEIVTEVVPHVEQQLSNLSENMYSMIDNYPSMHDVVDMMEPQMDINPMEHHHHDLRLEDMIDDSEVCHNPLSLSSYDQYMMGRQMYDESDEEGMYRQYESVDPAVLASAQR